VKLIKNSIPFFFIKKEKRNTILDEFSPVLLKKDCFFSFNGISYLLMNNLDFEEVGHKKANEQFGEQLITKCGSLFNGNSIDYNLFLMGLFHSKVNLFNDVYKNCLTLADYTDMEGNPHSHTADDPGINDSGEGYLRFKETLIQDKSYIKIIDQYNKMLEYMQDHKMLPVIDGDWKYENIYRSYKVDFACVGLGRELDDLAYFLTDSKLEIGFEGFQNYIASYISYRSLHDQEFKNSILDNLNDFQKFSTSSWLRQLVLRHSVMKKRDLNDMGKMKSREYYKYRIHDVLKESKFI